MGVTDGHVPGDVAFGKLACLLGTSGTAHDCLGGTCAEPPILIGFTVCGVFILCSILLCLHAPPRVGIAAANR